MTKKNNLAVDKNVMKGFRNTTKETIEGSKERIEKKF